VPRLPRAARSDSVRTLTVRTERQSQLVDITRLVRDAVAGETGAAVLVYVPHTTAGVTINEHADPMVARDFEMALERIVPEDWGWQHIEEGEENAPTHIRAAFMGPSVLVPLQDGALALGTWQGIFFCEFDGPRERSVHVSVLQ
jgi:secondary thiamine-phosphate synthase enzyme